MSRVPGEVRWRTGLEVLTILTRLLEALFFEGGAFESWTGLVPRFHTSRAVLSLSAIDCPQ